MERLVQAPAEFEGDWVFASTIGTPLHAATVTLASRPRWHGPGCPEPVP